VLFIYKKNKGGRRRERNLTTRLSNRPRALKGQNFLGEVTLLGVETKIANTKTEQVRPLPGGV